MDDPLRYIIVGTGGFGACWCRDFLPRLARLGKAVPAAAVDLDAGALVNAREGLGLPPEKCYTDVDRAFTENGGEADFVIVVVPPAFHESVVDAALASDCHILSEKPIADTMETSARIYSKVRAAGKKMAVTMSHRFDRDRQTLERLVNSGDYGGLNYVVGRNTWDCRTCGAWGEFRYKIADPLLVEGTVHHFDIMRSLAGSDAKTVHAITWNPKWSEFAGDAQGLILVEMMNGVKVFYEGAKANSTTLNNWCADYWRAECEKATLELDNRKLRVMSDLGGGRKVDEVPLDEREAWMNPWIAEMFCDWLAGGAPPPTHLDDNIQCAALLFAAIESAHSGKIVDVQEYLQRHLERAPVRTGGRAPKQWTDDRMIGADDGE